ncbi:MAG TPA: hypothetical protein VHK63_09080 [Candidatus Limnocylindria bacterium]|nr:hypothetical protein [Candidatus Limnocylindria bacterium]
MSRQSISALILALFLAMLGIGVVSAGDGPLPRTWREVRAAVARYHSFEQAMRDGYTVEGEPCVASPDGTMGIHAINPPLMSDEEIDPLRPEILLYVEKANGKLELVGVEYWKADADGDLATAGDRPSVLGQPLDGPMPGHNPFMPVHYDLHVWVAAEHPTGLFAPFNPALSC